MAGQLTGARARLLRLLAFALALVVWSSAVAAESSDSIVRVEEDWELVVGTPDPYTNAPQMTCLLSPNAHTDGYYGAFVLNHQSLPVFEDGGLQLQIWDGEVPMSDRKFPDGNVMSQTGETVIWTQSMELDNGILSFEIRSGNSTTWGSFGGQGYLKSSVPSPLESLNSYDPAVSAENSGVGYAGNRVDSLVLKKVRLYTSDGAVLEDTTPRVVHTAN